MITSHGRATPLLWKTVMKSELHGWRNEHEDVLLERFREVVPKDVKVTVLADRGFGDVPTNGRPLLLRGARVRRAVSSASSSA